MAPGTYTSPIYLFGSTQGGAGKTTLIANLAVYLNAKGRRVAVIDGQAGQPLQMKAAFPRSVTLETYADLGELQTTTASRFRRTFFFTNTDRISLFPAHRLASLASLVSDAALRDFLLQARAQFDLLLVNLPPGAAAFADLEAFTGPGFARLGTRPLAVLVSRSDLRSLVAFDALLRARPALGYLLRERLAVVFNQVPRGVEDQTIVNPSLSLTDIRRLFPLPAVVGLPVLDDLARQAQEATPLVLTERSPVRQAVATLARSLAELHDAPTPWDLPPDPEGWSLSVDGPLLERLGPYVDRLQAVVAHRLFIPREGVHAYLEMAERKVRIRVRLARSLRPNFPPWLKVDHRAPQRLPSPLDAPDRIEGFRSTLGRRSVFRDLVSVPRLTAKPLYQFDDRFALRTAFRPRDTWEYLAWPRVEREVAEFPFAGESPDLPGLSQILHLGRSMPLRLAFRHPLFTDEPTGLRHFFLPPEFDLWVEFRCRHPQVWLSDAGKRQRGPGEPRPARETAPAPLERPLELKEDIPDLFRRTWRLAHAEPPRPVPQPVLRERFTRVKRSSPAQLAPEPLSLPAPPPLTRAEPPPVVPGWSGRLACRLLVPLPALHWRRGRLPERFEREERPTELALHLPADWPPRSRLGQLLGRPLPEPILFGALPAQVLTAAALAPIARASQIGRSEPTLDGAVAGPGVASTLRLQSLRGGASPRPSGLDQPPRTFAMAPVLIGHRFSLVPWWGNERFRETIAPTKADREARFDLGRLLAFSTRWLEPTVPAMPAALPPAPRLSFEYREFLWHFRNLGFQGFTAAPTCRHDLFPTRLALGPAPQVAGLPRWYQEPFVLLDPHPIGKRLPLRLPPQPLQEDPPVAPSRGAWWSWHRRILIRTAAPPARAVGFVGPDLPPPSSRRFRRERQPLAVCLNAGSLRLRPIPGLICEEGAPTVAWPPPPLRFSGYVPVEAWFHIASKSFTLIACHAVTFHVQSQTVVLSVPQGTAGLTDPPRERPPLLVWCRGPWDPPTMRIRHPGLPWSGPARPALRPHLPTFAGAACHLRAPPPEFPPLADRLPRFRVSFPASEPLPWRLRSQHPGLLIPGRNLPVPPPDVIEVLFRNLRERWHQYLEAGLAYPRQFRVARREGPLVPKTGGTEGGQAPRLRTRPFREPGRLELGYGRHLRIMTARLRDLLQAARQKMEATFRPALPQKS